ncbi:hypothetical protein GPECTOR_100g20 [Gonium pectorale]|uniref:Uncharacterized protein n=1 Tax=Gonium pectorale TaxID=33097 RepID=A0A150FZX8_GONPE|nr:hypothetical protein GPECTOR_100g20 [Gonium pectorale]|eukprot:KXZ43149.1 hypothetical protein GPECTOR_100g20 [Gonium pectorale]
MEQTATHGSAAAPSTEAGRITLAFPSGKTLSAQIAAIQNVSGVLKSALAQPLSTPGVLPLDDDGEDSIAAWSAVVQMAELRAYQPELVNWNNVGSLFNLVAKYDMPVVGAACSDFLPCNKASLGLDHPLTSPKNVLVAVTLCDRHGCTPAGCQAVEEALVSALSPLLTRVDSSGYLGSPDAAAAAARLRALIKDKRYTTAVSMAVQARVMAALLDALDAHCNAPTCYNCGTRSFTVRCIYCSAAPSS